MKYYIKKFALLCLGAALISGTAGDVRAESDNTENLPELVIGCDEYEPYNYFDENGNLVGIDADLAEEACSRMGYYPVYLLLKWTEKESYLEEGVIDCIWDSFSMNGREDDYLWSDPYMYSSESVVVSEESPSYTLTDIKNKDVATLGDTRSEDILLQPEIFKKVYPQKVYSLQSMDECLAALRQGYVDAVAGDRVYLYRYIRNYPGRFRFINEDLETSKIAVAFAKDGDQEFVEKLNKTLAEMKQDGTISKILAKYETPEITPVEEEDSE